MSASSTTTVEVREGRFGAREVRIPAAAEGADVRAAVERALAEVAGKAAVYLFLPLLDRTGVAAHVPEPPSAPAWKPFTQTDAYSVLVWDPTGKVPAAATSVEGAHVLIVSGGALMAAAGTTASAAAAAADGGKPVRVFLARKRGSGRWSMIGGAVDAGESVETAALREMSEELGVTAEALSAATLLGGGGPDDSPLLYVGNYHRSSARRHGTFAEDDPAMLANDTCHFFVLPVDEAKFNAALGTAAADGELEEMTWFDVDSRGRVPARPEDVAAAAKARPDAEAPRYAPLFWSNAQVIERVVRNPRAFWPLQRDKDTVFVWPRM